MINDKGALRRFAILRINALKMEMRAFDEKQVSRIDCKCSIFNK